MTQDKETVSNVEVKEEENEETIESDASNATENSDPELGEQAEASLTEEEKLKELNEQLSEVTNRLYRTQADFDNFRRRTKEEREAMAKYRSQSLIEELLPVLDNFERALKVDAENDQIKTLLQGMEMVYRQLVSAVTGEGVEEITAEGEEFDPHLHQAVMQVESDEHQPNAVVEVLQKGYKLKDRIIRPALVKVNSN